MEKMSFKDVSSCFKLETVSSRTYYSKSLALFVTRLTLIKNLVEDLQGILDIKYKRSWPDGFNEEDF